MKKVRVERLRLESAGGWGWVGDQDMPRYMKAMEPGRRNRSICHCGGQMGRHKATHLGFANGVCLIGGCEWTVRLWVRDVESWSAQHRERAIEHMQVREAANRRT